MDQTLLTRLVRTTIAAVIGISALSSLSLAAQFSADIVDKSGSSGFASHVYVRDGVVRREMRHSGTLEAVIYRLDKHVMWILQVPEKTYIETDAIQPSAWMCADYSASVKDIATTKKLGSEKVSGYECDKYVIFFKDAKRGKIIQWVSKKLNHPLKVRTVNQRGDMTICYTNIVEKKLPDRLFEIPTEFKRLQ